ncbi:MAG TPA: 6-phosphofructokinase [Candidatus Brocadiia bacterium]|nr:6-phosphofructokinase [Candidatus Brocadiia bacterium]
MADACCKPEKRNKVGIIVGGGPAPGINSVIRGAALAAAEAGVETLGFLSGCEGLISGNHRVLSPEYVGELLRRGGICIGTSRKRPSKTAEKDEFAIIHDVLAKLGVRGLVTIGGDDTLGTARRLNESGIPCVHVCKTIDNDLPATDITFGHDTAVGVAADILADLATDARSAGRWVVAELMGRQSGSLAFRAGLAAGVHRTLIRETFQVFGMQSLETFAKSDDPLTAKAAKDELMRCAGATRLRGAQLDLNKSITGQMSGADDMDLALDIATLVQQQVDLIKARRERGLNWGVLVVAEGLAYNLNTVIVERDADGKPKMGLIKGLSEDIPLAYDEHGNPRVTDLAIGGILQKEINARDKKAKPVFKQVGYELRCTDPSAFDVRLCTRLGVKAMELLLDDQGGRMVGYQNDEVVPIGFHDPSVVTKDANGKEVVRVRLVDVDSDLFIGAKKAEYINSLFY